MQWDFERVIYFLNESIKIIKKHQGNLNAEFKEDGSIVTQVDKEIENFLSQQIEADGTFLIGEETISKRGEKYIKDALQAPNAFIIDPIDGTSPFAAGLPSYGVSIAYVNNGKIKEGAIVTPLSGEFFISFGNEVFYAKKNPLEEVSKEDFSKYTFSLKEEYDFSSLLCVSKSIVREFDIKTYAHVHVNGSCVYSFLKVFTGSYQAYFSSVGLWDIAACLAIGDKLGLNGEFYNGTKMSLSISGDMYFLEKEDLRRWMLKDFFIYAGSGNIIETIRKEASKKK